MAVGETCVDAERMRKFEGREVVTLQHRKAEGNRAIALPLIRVVNRGTKATHGGIGLEDGHHGGQHVGDGS